MFSQFWIVQPLDFDTLCDLISVSAVHKLQPITKNIICTDEVSADTDRPRRWSDINRKILLNLIDDFKSVTAFAVHLVAKCQDGQITQAADFKKLLGLALNTLSTINDHHGGINGRQRPVRVFRKVGVAGRIDEVEAKILKVKRHCGSADRNPAVLLHLHEI